MKEKPKRNELRNWNATENNVPAAIWFIFERMRQPKPTIRDTDYKKKKKHTDGIQLYLLKNVELCGIWFVGNGV